MSKLLLNKDGLILFNRDLACIDGIGVNGAIALQQVHYWVDINKKGYLKGESSYLNKYHHGRFWTYNSISQWQKENFPFWSEKTVQRTFDKLIEAGYLIEGNFNEEGYDRTKWYTINYEKLQEKEAEVDNLIAKRENEKIERIQKKNKMKLEREIVKKELEDIEKTHSDKMSKCVKHSFGQNDQMIWTSCPNDLDKVTEPIPKISTKLSSLAFSPCTTQENVSSDNKEIIEDNTHLKLSNNMIKKVKKWDSGRLLIAIDIFKKKEGTYFALLEKIYNDNGNFTPYTKDKINPMSFNNFEPRDYTEEQLKAIENKLLGWDK